MANSVGLRELAEHLGVSIGSVSNALNRPDLVSKEMRERVTAAAGELGFVKNELARQLKTGFSTTIGMIVLDIMNPFFASLAAECQAAADSRNYQLVVASSDQDESRQDRFVTLFEQQRVGGLLVTTTGGPTRVMDDVAKRGTPLVLFGDDTAPGPFCSVAMNGERAGAIAVEHLWSLGRRQIAFVGGPRPQVMSRLRGAREAAERLGASFEVLETDDHTIPIGARIGEYIRSLSPALRPDGVLCATDLLAIGLLQDLVLKSDIHVPKDIAIIGVDDVEYAASAVIPLTSVRQPVRMIADLAVQLLEDGAKSSAHVHEHIRLEPELVVRASTVS